MNINYNIIPTLNVVTTYLDTLDFNSIFFGINTPFSLILIDLVITFHLHFLKLPQGSLGTLRQALSVSFQKPGSPTHTVNLYLVTQHS